MDIVLLVLLLGVSLAFIFGLPFGIAEFCYNYLKRKKVPLYFRWIAVIPALICLFALASWIFPDEHLSERDYWEITAYQFPSEATFLYRDFNKKNKNFSFGMQTSPENYISIVDIVQRRGFLKDSTTKIPNIIESFLSQNNQKIIQQLSLTRYSNYNYYIELCSDSSTIFMRKEAK